MKKALQMIAAFLLIALVALWIYDPSIVAEVFSGDGGGSAANTGDSS